MKSSQRNRLWLLLLMLIPASGLCSPIIEKAELSTVFNAIKTETAAGIFGFGLFNQPIKQSKSVMVADSPLQGTGWIKLLESKSNADTTHRLYLSHDELAAQIAKLSPAELKAATKTTLEKLIKLELALQQQRADDCAQAEQQQQETEVESITISNIYCDGNDSDAEPRIVSHYRQSIADLSNIDKLSQVSTSKCLASIKQLKPTEQCSQLMLYYKALGYLSKELSSHNSTRDESYYDEQDSTWELYDQAEQKCEQELGQSSTDITCESMLLATDYENKYKRLYRPTLSYQMTLGENVKIARSHQKQMADKLNLLMEQIRQTTQKQLGADSQLKLHPVTIAIGGDGLNITASNGSKVLTFPEELLRDIYLRAFYRASANTALTLGEAFASLIDSFAPYEQLEQIETQDTSTYLSQFSDKAMDGLGVMYGDDEHMWYSGLITDYLNLLNDLDGLAFYVFNPNAIYHLTQKIPKEKRTEQIDHFINYLSYYSNRNEIISAFNNGITYGRLVQILKETQPILAQTSQDPGSDKLITEFLNDQKKLSRLKEQHSYLEVLEIELMMNSMLFSEGAYLSQSLSAELLKTYSFILAHESYHIWFGLKFKDFEQNEQEELDADRHAVRVFNEMFKEFDFNQWSEQIGSKLNLPMAFGSDKGFPETKHFFEQFLGRNPDITLYETYAETRYFSGGLGHPPWSTRLANVKTQIQQQKTRFTQQLVEQLNCVGQLVFAGNHQLEQCKESQP